VSLAARGGGGGWSQLQRKQEESGIFSSSFSMGPLPSGGPALFSLKCDPCIEPDTVHSTARAPLVPRMRRDKTDVRKETGKIRKKSDNVLVTMTVHV